MVLLHKGRIVADGPTESVITEENISQLYQRDIAILEVGNGVRTCLPRSILEGASASRRLSGFSRGK